MNSILSLIPTPGERRYLLALSRILLTEVFSIKKDLKRIKKCVRINRVRTNESTVYICLYGTN